MRPDGCYDEKVWGREAESEVEPGAGVRLSLEYEVKFPLSESVRGSLTHYVLVHDIPRSPVSPPAEAGAEARDYLSTQKPRLNFCILEPPEKCSYPFFNRQYTCICQGFSLGITPV